MKAQHIAALAGGLIASAAAAQTSETVYSIEANNASGSASWSISTADLGLDSLGSEVNWELDAPIELRDDETGELIAVLSAATSGVDPNLVASNNSAGTASSSLMADPSINLSFSVMAGAADTTFTINSAEISIDPALINVSANATAAITLTDGNGDGATMTGLVEGSEVGPAGRDILGPAVPPTSMFGSFLDDDSSGDNIITPFEFLIDSPVTTATSTSVEETMPPTPPDLASVSLEPIEAISSQFRFTLSAGDLASGTSRFNVVGEIIPAPSGAAALLAACGLIGRGRRRR